MTPLQLAAWRLEIGALAYLAGAGADPAFVNGFGCGVPHWIALAPRAAADAPGRHAAVAAWAEGHLGEDCWRSLNAQGHTALHKAGFAGHADFCAWLRDARGLEDAPDGHGNYAADLAREAGHADLCSWLRRRCAPGRKADVDALAAASGVDLGADPSDAALRRAFRRAALDAHPDRGGDAQRFERARAAHDRLARGVGCANENPLRNAATVRRLLDADAFDADAGGSQRALREFEARLAVVLLEQPRGLALGLLRRRYGRAWPDKPNYFPEDPRDFGYRKLVALVRAEAKRVARVEVDDGGTVVLFPVADRADYERRLLVLEGGGA